MAKRRRRKRKGGRGLLVVVMLGTVAAAAIAFSFLRRPDGIPIPGRSLPSRESSGYEIRDQLPREAREEARQRIREHIREDERRRLQGILERRGAD